MLKLILKIIVPKEKLLKLKLKIIVPKGKLLAVNETKF